MGQLLAPMAIEEQFLPVAMGQGWTVVIADADVMAAPLPVQSNPRRVADEDDGA